MISDIYIGWGTTFPTPARASSSSRQGRGTISLETMNLDDRIIAVPNDRRRLEQCLDAFEGYGLVSRLRDGSESVLYINGALTQEVRTRLVNPMNYCLRAAAVVHYHRAKTDEAAAPTPTQMAHVLQLYDMFQAYRDEGRTYETRVEWGEMFLEQGLVFIESGQETAGRQLLEWTRNRYWTVETKPARHDIYVATMRSAGFPMELEPADASLSV